MEKLVIIDIARNTLAMLRLVVLTRKRECCNAAGEINDRGRIFMYILAAISLELEA